jgi:hypothetical protein
MLLVGSSHLLAFASVRAEEAADALSCPETTGRPPLISNAANNPRAVSAFRATV